MQKLLDIMRRLRDPDSGCPWDLEQTFDSIAPHTIEEAYEVADTIERNALDELKDELGDLLFQIAFYTQMAAEKDLFDYAVVEQGICEKMERRHPHVFGFSQIENAEAQTVAWNTMKAEERRHKGASSMMDDIPRGMAELQKSVKIQRRAAEVGFDWPEPEPILDKIEEEIRELRQEIHQSDSEAMQDELGDLLFACTNLARALKLDPAQALRGANRKFERRFRAMETAAGGIEAFQALTLEAQEMLWQQIKPKTGAG